MAACSTTILVNASKVAKLADCGLCHVTTVTDTSPAGRADAPVQPCMVSGAAYPAPEVLLAQAGAEARVTPAADIFSFGLTVWALFAEKVRLLGHAGLGSAH